MDIEKAKWKEMSMTEKYHYVKDKKVSVRPSYLLDGNSMAEKPIIKRFFVAHIGTIQLSGFEESERVALDVAKQNKEWLRKASSDLESTN